MEKILVLHGWGIGSKTWSRVKNFLESGGYEVLTPDLPGFGDNSQPSKPWTVDDYAEWVNNFCEKNNLSQFFLLGHSFGGGISVKFNDKFPGKAKALILVSAKLHRQKTARYYIGVFLAKIGRVIFSIPGLSYLRSIAKKILYFFLGTHDYQKLELQKTDTMKETFKGVVGEDLILLLSKINIPTLIIWGTRDEMTPLKDAYLAKQEIKNSELKLIKGGKHALHMERPEELSEIIIKYLDGK